MIVLKAVENIEGFKTTVTFENIPIDKVDQKVDECINKFKQDTSYKKLIKIENDIEEIIFERWLIWKLHM